MKALSPEIECRAWTTLAQVGLQVIGGQLSASSHERHAWARNIEAEVRAITRSPRSSDLISPRLTEQSPRAYVAFLPKVVTCTYDPLVAERISSAGDFSCFTSNAEANDA